MEKQTDTNLVQDPEPERYYDWILWKLRQENTLERSRMKTISREEMWKQTVADMQGEIHALQKTVVKLQEQLTKLQDETTPRDRGVANASREKITYIIRVAQK